MTFGTDQKNGPSDEVRREAVDDVVVVSAPGAKDHGRTHHEVMSTVRYILNRHELHTGQKTPQMIAVVSALKGEGVTTVSRSLARVLTEASNDDVCWIELPTPDSGAGPLTELLRLPPELRSGTPAAPAAMAPAVPEPRVSQTLARMSRSGFEDVLVRLAAEYRHIVFDSPPLYQGRDALDFLRHADAYILVTRQGTATANQVRAVTQDLAEIPCLGAVLNDYRTRTPRFVRKFFT